MMYQDLQSFRPSQSALEGVMPGAALLDLSARTPIEVLELLEQGLPVRLVISKLRRATGGTEAELASFLGLSLATLHRRKTSNQRLKPDESARAYRLARVIARATEVLLSETEAREWLREPLLAIGNRTPLEAAATEIGAELVLQVLGRLEHGVFS